ncbi:tape measure protein [Lactobacillus sp. ESL0684]|uniref:tape measure protein n=1 Tax=Lactobacillus sp. ESL0684 TaxID=2983213 RepID=UPI0023F808BD|nr:tape measure protein [Lactobacillus sp. ESL0684]WEV42950.1 tape measure protein [Lactobacillus sp. ESL0684]
MSTIEATIKIVDAFSGPLNRLSGGLQKSMGGFEKLKSSLGGNTFGNATKQSNGFFKSMVGGTVIGGALNKGIQTITGSLAGAIDRLDTIDNASRSFQNMGFSAKSTQSAISSLDQAVNGLPTPIDSALRNTQLLAASTGNLDKSTQIFKAMNDGILGFGGTSAMVNNAVLQLSQSLANGKIDGTTWNSMINSNMGPALEAVAKKMSITTGALKEGLSQGKISVKSFEDQLIDLDKHGGGGLKSLTQIAADSTKGIKTSFANLQTGIKNALATGILKPLVDAGLTDTLNQLTNKIKASGPKIADAFSQIIVKVKSISTDVFSGFKSTGALSAVNDMLHELGDSIGNVMNKASAGGGNNFFTQLGSFAGGAVRGAANAISAIAQAIGQMDPSTLKALGAAFIVLKGGVKGLVLAGVVAGLSKIGQMDSGQINNVASAIKALVAALIGFKVLGGIANTIMSISGALNGLKAMLEGMQTMGTALTAAMAPIAGTIAIALAAVTVVIISAVYAWQNNLLGFRNFISGIFNNIGNIFAPFMQALGNLGNALSPIGNMLSGLGKIIASGVAGAIMKAVQLFGLLVDAITMAIDAIAGIISMLRMFADGCNVALQAIRDLVTRNWSFSNAKNAMKDVQSDVDNMKRSFAGIGDVFNNGATATINSVFDQISSKAKNAKANIDNIKAPNIAQSNANVMSMNNIAGNKQALGKAKVKVGYEFDANPLAKMKVPAKMKVKADTSSVDQTQQRMAAKFGAKPVKTKFKADTSSLTETQQKAQAKFGTKPMKMKVATPKVPTPKSSKVKPLKVKVARPKIPQPKRPKIKPLHVKVARPTIPQPKRPKLMTLHVKVARPTIPTPKMPKLAKIAAPKVGKPSMAGVVSAIRSGMNQAVAAVRAGGTKMGAAVQQAVSRAAAIARTGVGPMRSAGSMIGAGLAAGMRSQIGAVAAAADALVAQANRAARAKAKIHSPSKLFAEVGGFIGQGMAMGMMDTVGLVSTAGGNLINAANSGASGSVGLDYKGLGAITADSLARSQNISTQNSSSDNSRVLTIEKGAIQITGSHNPEQTAEDVLAAIENKMVEIDNRKL